MRRCSLQEWESELKYSWNNRQFQIFITDWVTDQLFLMHRQSFLLDKSHSFWQIKMTSFGCLRTECFERWLKRYLCPGTTVLEFCLRMRTAIFSKYQHNKATSTRFYPGTNISNSSADWKPSHKSCLVKRGQTAVWLCQYDYKIIIFIHHHLKVT